MKQNIATTSQRIEQFASLVQAGIEAWYQAGQIVAQAVDEDDDFIEKLCARHPEFTPDFVRRFEQIGRKLIHPRLLISDAPGCRRLARLGYPIQERALQKGVEVLVRSGNGWDTINVDVVNLTKEQAQQVFAHDHVRSAAEQRAYIESQQTFRMAPRIAPEESFMIVRGTLVVNKSCSFTKTDLTRILKTM